MDKNADIIKKHQSVAPISTVKIANDLGIRVYTDPQLPDDLSGLIKKENPDEYAIYVNQYHPATRQRFTVAHELAHFCLHKEFIGDGLRDDYMYRSGLSNSQEREANKLAAEILMPEHLLIEYDYKNKPIAVLAKKFNVSEEAMSIRLRNLGFTVENN